MTASLFLWGAFAAAALAAGWDVLTRRIPNWSVVILAILALGYAAIGLGWPAAGWSGLHALIALVVGMILFRFGLIGAGDAKLYAAAALAVPLHRALPMLGYVALGGLVLWLALFMVNRGLRARRTQGKGSSWTLPYGLPIAGAFIVTMAPALQ